MKYEIIYNLKVDYFKLNDFKINFDYAKSRINSIIRLRNMNFLNIVKEFNNLKIRG